MAATPVHGNKYVDLGSHYSERAGLQRYEAIDSIVMIMMFV